MGNTTAATTGGASGAGRNSRTDMISMLTQLAPSLFGSGTTSGTNTQTITSSSGKDITPEQLKAIIGNMMSSTNGLASVLMPQRQVGLYNSPVNTLLGQQFASRIAGEAALQSTKEVTNKTHTTTDTKKTSASPTGKVLGGGLALLQGASMAKKAWDSKSQLAKLLGLNSSGADVFSNFPGLEGNMFASAGSANPSLGLDLMGTTGFESGISYSPSSAIDYVPSYSSDTYTPELAMDYSYTSPFANSASELFGPPADLMDFFGPPADLMNQVSSMGASASEFFGPSIDLMNQEVAGMAMNQVASTGAGAISDIFGSLDDWMSELPSYDLSGIDASGYDFFADGVRGAAADYSDWASNSFDGSSMGTATASIPYVNIAVNALDGEWGWNDTGAVVGSAIGGPIGGMIGSAIGEPVGDIVEGVGEGIGDVLGDIGGGCFLTTACMVALADDFKDDCRELEAMRQLRDGYAQTLDEGPALIQRYYKTAPSYVLWINAREDATEVWKSLYSDYLMPAVIAVEKEHFHKAYELYVTMVKKVESLVTEEGK